MRTEWLVFCVVLRNGCEEFKTQKPLVGMALERSGTPVGSRTPNLLIRSQTLYPIELRVHPRQPN